MRMEDTIESIEQADSGEINDLLLAVIARYKFLFPDQEFHFFTVPNGDPEKRQRELEKIVQFVRDQRG